MPLMACWLPNLGPLLGCIAIAMSCSSLLFLNAHHGELVGLQYIHKRVFQDY